MAITIKKCPSMPGSAQQYFGNDKRLPESATLLSFSRIVSQTMNFASYVPMTRPSDMEKCQEPVSKPGEAPEVGEVSPVSKKQIHVSKPYD